MKFKETWWLASVLPFNKPVAEQPWQLNREQSVDEHTFLMNWSCSDSTNVLIHSLSKHLK